MPDEKKTYLLKVESNLKEVTDDAVKTKKAWDDAKDSLAKLKKEGIDSGPEFEKLSAAVKSTGQEYRNAQKNLITLTAASKDNATVRDKLNAIITIETQKLKSLGDGYIKDANGLLKINPLYVQQKKNLADANLELIKYDQSINKGTTNIGRYGESVGAAFKEAGKSILSMVGPAALVSATIAAGKKIFEGLKEAIMSTTAAINFFNITSAMTKQLLYDIAINGNMSLTTMARAAEIQQRLNELRTEGYREGLLLSKVNREEQALREQSVDRTKTHAERLELLNQVKAKHAEITKITVEHLTKELKATNDLIAIRSADEKLRQKGYELMTKINDAYAEEDAAMRRVETQRTGFMEERNKMFEDWHKKLQDAADFEIEQNVKNLEERKKLSDDLTNLLQKEKDDINGMILKTSEIINAEIKKNETLKKIDTKTLKWNKDVQKQNEAIIADGIKADNYATESWVANRKLAAEALGQLSELVGAQTEAGKAFAVAQTLINTYVAGEMVMTDKTIPSTFARIAMMALVILQGLNNVKNILAVNTSGKGISGSAPTSISSSPPAMRSFATSTGSTVLTQPQLSQAQLNALPSQNLLTAEDIANALRNMPAPIVSVEDINAKIKAKQKIDVRATI